MSRAARCIRCLVLSSCSSRPTQTHRSAINASRRYTQSALQEQELPPPQLLHHRKRNSRLFTGMDQTGWSPDPTERRLTDGRRMEYFARLFGSLQFPPELAHRVLTHNSHSAARQGHNAALAFIGTPSTCVFPLNKYSCYFYLGRRVIAAYFMLFLHSSHRLKPTDDLEDIAAKSLNTHLLGEYVGNEWGVGRELVWAPSISMQLKSEGHFPGLYKVQGETVQAIMGAIYHQFVNTLFCTSLVPLLIFS